MMNVRSLARVVVTAAFLMTGLAAQAAPTPINGSVHFDGNGTPVHAGPPSGSWFDSIGVLFGSTWLTVGSSGDLAVPNNTAATFTSFNWGAGSGAVSIPVGSIWTYSSGGLTYSLTLATVNLITRGNAVTDTIDISGTGTLSITGGTSNFAPTAGVWSFHGAPQVPGLDLMFASTATPTQVPEPATLALIGIALAGLGLSRRRKQA